MNSLRYQISGFCQRAIFRRLPTHLWLFLVTACSVLTLDQVSKAFVVGFSDGEDIVLIDNFLSIELARNPGAAFSLGEGYTWLFTTLALVVVLGMLFLLFWRRNHLRRSELFIAGIFYGGVAGNLADRLFRDPGFFVGHVVDFISVGSWPTFNFADSSIFISFILYLFIDMRAKSKRR